MTLDKSYLALHTGSPEELADAFSAMVFAEKERSFPINPFAILTLLDIPFVFTKLKKLEGLLIADEDDSIPAMIAINSKRPIQRQRYTCAHEICHFIKDVGSYDPYSCTTGSKIYVERFAESFAAAFLMPRNEVIRQSETYKQKLYPDDILRIAEYFGTSYQACRIRIRQCNPKKLRDDYVYDSYKPAKRREDLGFNDTSLYEMTLDSWTLAWPETAESHAAYVFKNNYIYNDARLENIDINEEEAAMIVTDLRLKAQRSIYCDEDHAAFSEIAGHSLLYDHIFRICHQPSVSIYTLTDLNRILFSCVPFPEFGGRTRSQNTAVIGAKFETADYHDVMKSLISLNEVIGYLEENHYAMSKSEIVRIIASIHHKLTVIHPFPDGNGRTIRAFTNLLFLRYGLPPVYIRTEIKKDYINALSKADAGLGIDNLYSLTLQLIFKSHAEFMSLQ